MTHTEERHIPWTFEFRVVTPDEQVLAHTSYSAFDDMPTIAFSGHVNRAVDRVYEALKEKGYITE